MGTSLQTRSCATSAFAPLTILAPGGQPARVEALEGTIGRATQRTDDQVLTLADYAIKIEDHYSRHHGHTTPMDIEWAKDGLSQELFILQARPETVQSRKRQAVLRTWHLAPHQAEEAHQGSRDPTDDELEDEAEVVLQFGVVFHHQNSHVLGHGVISSSGARPLTGIRIVKVLPRPGALSTNIDPPKLLMML